MIAALVLAYILAGVSGESQTSFKMAEGVQRKIDAIKAKPAEASRKRDYVEVSNVEVESYILLLLQHKIPAKLDSVDVQFIPADVAMDTELTFGPGTTGNYIVDRVIQGKHRLFVKGKFAGWSGQGKFQLESVTVDHIRVPVLLAELVFNKLVRSILPQSDIRALFRLPFGIDGVASCPEKQLSVTKPQRTIPLRKG